jgi:hypothetical protein
LDLENTRNDKSMSKSLDDLEIEMNQRRIQVIEEVNFHFDREIEKTRKFKVEDNSNDRLKNMRVVFS